MGELIISYRLIESNIEYKIDNAKKEPSELTEWSMVSVGVRGFGGRFFWLLSVHLQFKIFNPKFEVSNRFVLDEVNHRCHGNGLGRRLRKEASGLSHVSWRNSTLGAMQGFILVRGLKPCFLDYEIAAVKNPNEEIPIEIGPLAKLKACFVGQA